MGGHDDNPSGKDDLDLFRAAVADVAPLREERADFYRRRRRPTPLELPTGEEEEDAYGDLQIETGDFLDFQRPGVQNRVYQDLRRGVIAPEDSLDMHGMRVHEARKAFARFLASSLHAGRRCVRIVHGKGRGSEGRQPVLKQKANQWLRQNDAVLAFTTAPRWDGGTGAVYVLLSRKQRRTP